MPMLRLLFLLLFCFASLGAEEERTSWWGYIRDTKGESWTAIRSQEEYEKFLERIPKKRIQKRQPAPDSKDPLLQKPPIDFNKHALVAVWTDNIYLNGEVQSWRREGDDLVVALGFDAPTEDVYNKYARPIGIGQYHVVRVDEFPGKLKVEALNKKAPKEKQPEV